MMLKELELNQLDRIDTESYRKSKNFLRQLFGYLAVPLLENAYHKVISETRIPNERELYGIMAQALSLVCSSSKMPLLSEFSVTKNEVKGRVDFIAFYRGTAFFVEFKVARIVYKDTQANTEVEVDDDNGNEIGGTTVQKITKPWSSAIEQLSDNVEVDFLRLDGVEQIIKIPLVLYFHTDNRGKDNMNKADSAALTAEYIIKQISNSYDDPIPSFVTFAEFDKPFQTRKRKGPGLEQQPVVNAYGYTLIAGCAEYLQD